MILTSVVVIGATGRRGRPDCAQEHCYTKRKSARQPPQGQRREPVAVTSFMQIKQITILYTCTSLIAWFMQPDKMFGLQLQILDIILQSANYNDLKTLFDC